MKIVEASFEVSTWLIIVPKIFVSAYEAARLPYFGLENY